MAVRYFTQDNGDGTYSLVQEYAPGGYTVVAGPSADKNFIQQQYNQAVGQGAGGGGGGAGDWTATLGNFAAGQLQVSLLNQQYLRERLNLLEIPEMQSRTELERKQLAMQSALSYSQMMGWVIAPGDLENSLSQLQQSVTYNVTWPDGNTKTMTVSDLRDALQQAGYPNWQNAQAQELQQVFQRTSGAQITSQMAPVGTGIPTFERELAMAQMATDPGRFLNFLSMAGATPQQTAGFLNQLPYMQRLQGYGLPGQIQQTAGGTNPLFPFIQGRQMPVRETLNLQQTQSPLIPFLSSVAGFSGQDPSQFWGEFESFLPKGTTAPITGVA